jgi:hypothetical protein
MKKFLSLIFIILMFFMFSCNKREDNSSDTQLQNKTETMLREANSQLGLPAIKNFQEKKTLKWIYELCDQENLICYAYLYNSYKGKVGQFLGKCIGYGIPYSTQYSNPEKEVYKGGYQQGFGTLPQAEPNGIFKPEGLSATWLIMIDPKTKKQRPVYVEPEIIVSPFPLK